MPVRERFFVELKDNETTVVSWKKLLKDAEKALASPGQAAASDAPAGANPALEARIAPEKGTSPVVAVSEEEPLPAPLNRFSSVIEKIERLYKGGESDDENVEGNVDEDQYDSDDPFIDDRELNEYFTVEKAKTKHTGFFINRGALEKINDTLPTPIAMLQKRRRQDVRRLSWEANPVEDCGKRRLKNRVRMKDAARRTQHYSGALVESGTSDAVFSGPFCEQLAATGEHGLKPDAEQHDHRLPFCVPRKRKKAKALRELAGDGEDGDCPWVSSSRVEACATEFGTLSACTDRDTYQETDPIFFGTSFLQGVDRDVHRPDDVVGTSGDVEFWKDAIAQAPADGSGVLYLSKEEETRDSDGAAAKHASGQPQTSTSPGEKEVSPGRRAGWPKGTVLERAIQDLERGVAECCPPTADEEEPEQPLHLGGKAKRLPRDVKQRLAKVARLAVAHLDVVELEELQAKQGKVPDELVDRLMGILGHVMRLKTLKRNLKEMVELGLSAKHEKEGRLQDIKREVTEMVKSQVSALQAQPDAELRETSPDDFQATPGSTEKAGSSGHVKYKWDHATEDRLCNLYEQYLEGMDEHKGPQIRKLYVELAELWPEGWMDNNGIKLAVYRAKERKKQLKKLNKEPRRRQRAGPSSEAPSAGGEGPCPHEVAPAGRLSWGPPSNEFIPNPTAYHQAEHATLAPPLFSNLISTES